jgi:hypothetical protein
VVFKYKSAIKYIGGKDQVIRRIMRTLLFVMGEIKLSPEAKMALKRTGASWGELLARHGAGDYGDVTEAQKRRNLENAPGQGGVLSGYILPDATRINIYTNIERSRTFIVVEGQGLTDASE